jgi:peptidoglycan/LPS O-acetylase OafA/YrhL
MTPDRPAPLKHVPELDAVRGIAFLLVFGAHLWPGAPGWDWLNTLARYGWVGVDLFFVLSGFLITSILWHDREAPHYFLHFYARRVLRILPAFYLLFLVLWLLNGARGGLEPPGGQAVALPSVLPHHALLYFFMLANLSAAIYGGLYAPLDVTWSLSVEEHFYAVWPLVVRRLRLRTLVIVLLAIVLVEPVLRYLAIRAGFTDEQVYILTPFRLGGLALGSLVALALANDLVSVRGLQRTARWTLATGGTVFVVAAAGGWIVPASESARRGTLLYTIISLLMTALLVTALLPGRIAQAVFRLRPLQYVGKISYGCYLFHWVCAVLVNAVLRRFGYSIVWNETPIGQCIAYVAAVLAVTLVVCTVTWRLVERPILGLKRYFDAWGGRQHAPVRAAVPTSVVQAGGHAVALPQPPNGPANTGS